MYPGSSMARRSPGARRTRAMTSSACCVPLVMMMSSADASIARARLDKALAGEPVVGDAHRRAGHAEAARELARRRQAIAGAEPASDNGTAELPIDLAAEIVAADKADMEFHAANLCPSIGLVDSAGIGTNAGPFLGVPITHERIVIHPCLAGRTLARS